MSRRDQGLTRDCLPGRAVAISNPNQAQRRRRTEVLLFEDHKTRIAMDERRFPLSGVEQKQYLNGDTEKRQRGAPASVFLRTQNVPGGVTDGVSDVLGRTREAPNGRQAEELGGEVEGAERLPPNRRGVLLTSVRVRVRVCVLSCRLAGRCDWPTSSCPGLCPSGSVTSCGKSCSGGGGR